MKNKKSTLTIALIFICLLLISFVSKFDFAGTKASSKGNFVSAQNYELRKKSKKKNKSTKSKATESKKVIDFKSLSKEEQDKIINRIKDKSLLDKLDVITIDEEYDTKEELGAYLLIFDRLPSNYHKKKDRDFDSRQMTPKGNVYMIGGDRFMNFEGQLPESKNRKYFECDLYDNEKDRGPFRLIYSNDGLIYYTDDHYDSFTLIVDKSTK